MGLTLYPRPPDEYAEIRRQLAAIGNNINQIARTVNARGFASGEDIAAITAAQETIGTSRSGCDMAYTKVFAIRARLDDRVKYAVNGEKTELDERIVYTADPEKTDTVRFVTTLNCRSAETAFAAMQKTKKKYKKTGGVLGYHFIPILCTRRGDAGAGT